MPTRVTEHISHQSRSAVDYETLLGEIGVGVDVSCNSRAGFHAPADISLVSFGGASRMNALAKRLSAVTVDEIMTARLIDQLLGEMLRGDRAITDVTVFPAPLGSHQGETVAAPPTTTKRWTDTVG